MNKMFTHVILFFSKKTLKCPLEPPQLGEDMRRDSESLESIPAGLSLSCTL